MSFELSFCFFFLIVAFIFNCFWWQRDFFFCLFFVGWFFFQIVRKKELSLYTGSFVTFLHSAPCTSLSIIRTMRASFFFCWDVGMRICGKPTFENFRFFFYFNGGISRNYVMRYIGILALLPGCNAPKKINNKL